MKNANDAAAVRLWRDYIKGDETTTTTVEYLDLSSWLTGAHREVWIQVYAISADLMILPVESATPAVTPTITSVAAGGTMYPVGAGTEKSFLISADTPFLAYAALSGTGKLRVARG